MTLPVVAFVAITYGLAIGLALLVGFTGAHRSPWAGLGITAMLFPALAVLVLRLTLKERLPPLGAKRFPLPYALIALLLIPFTMHAVMLPLAAALEGGLPWQLWLRPDADGLYHAPEARGWGTLTHGALVARLVLNAAVGLAVVSAIAFFEEVGWRAWLMPRLAEHMSDRRAIVVSAALWAFWHTPFALSGIHHLDGVSVALTAMVLPIGHLGAGLVLGWLWIRSRSIWIVMLGHGALNNWGQYAFKFMEGAGAIDALLLAVGGAAVLAVGAALVWRRLPATVPAV